MFKPSFFSRERRGCVENVGFVNSGQISDGGFKLKRLRAAVVQITQQLTTVVLSGSRCLLRSLGFPLKQPGPWPLKAADLLASCKVTALLVLESKSQQLLAAIH
jgi:hypothetical protein